MNRYLLTAICLPLILMGCASPSRERSRGLVPICGQPIYPPDAIRAGHEGTTKLHLHVNSNGAVAFTDVVYSSGYPELDGAAQAFMSTCHFQPVDGSPYRQGERDFKYDYVWRIDPKYKP